MMYREQILKQIAEFESEKRRIERLYSQVCSIWQYERLRLLERNIASYKSLLPMAKSPKRANPLENNPHRPRTKEHKPPERHGKYIRYQCKEMK